MLPLKTVRKICRNQLEHDLPLWVTGVNLMVWDADIPASNEYYKLEKR